MSTTVEASAHTPTNAQMPGAMPAVIAGTDEHRGNNGFESYISDYIAWMIKSNDWTFEVNGVAIEPGVLASNTFMLPAILWEAEKTHQLLLGSPMGVEFVGDSQALVGAKALVNLSPGVSRTMFTVFSLEVLCRALENFPLQKDEADYGQERNLQQSMPGAKLSARGSCASMDHLVQSFAFDSQMGLVPWVTDPNARTPMQSMPS